MCQIAALKHFPVLMLLVLPSYVLEDSQMYLCNLLRYLAWIAIVIDMYLYFSVLGNSNSSCK